MIWGFGEGNAAKKAAAEQMTHKDVDKLEKQMKAAGESLPKKSKGEKLTAREKGAYDAVKATEREQARAEQIDVVPPDNDLRKTLQETEAVIAAGDGDEADETLAELLRESLDSEDETKKAA